MATTRENPAKIKKKMSESERFAHMFDKSIGLVRKWPEIRVGLMADIFFYFCIHRIISWLEFTIRLE